MEVKAALHAGFFRLRGFKAAVARIDVAFQADLGVGQAISVHGARFNQTHGRALHGSGDTDFVAALRQDDIVESGAGEQRACRR